MQDHAKAVFKLNQQQPDGSTLREHLEAAEHATGRRSPDLDTPPLPPACRDLWNLFLRLHERRGSTGFAPQPLDEARLLAWCQLYGQQLTSWECDALFSLDRLWRQACEDARPAGAAASQKPPAH